MTRFHPGTVVTIVSLALALAMTQPAAAQRGRRSFGQPFGGAWPAQLVLLEQVQSELKLNDEQKAKAAEINEKLRSDRRELFQRVPRESGERQPQLEKLNHEATARIEAVLDEAQRKRLKEITLQVNGAAALGDAEVAKALGITDDQEEKWEEIRAANAQAIRDAVQRLGSAPAEKRRQAMAKLRRDGDEKLLAVLTAEQREQFAKMQGKKIDLDLSELFRTRGN